MAQRRGSGEGSIYQDKSGRWIASITVTGGGGRQVRRKRSARTRSEARTRLKELQDQESLGAGTSGRLTLAKYLDAWVDRQEVAGKKAEATIDNYHWAIDKHLKPAVGSILLSRLTPDDVERVLNGMAEAGAAANTMLRVRAVLSMTLADAVRRRLLVWNPASVTTTPIGPKKTSRSMSPEQAAELLQAAEGDRLEAG